MCHTFRRGRWRSVPIECWGLIDESEFSMNESSIVNLSSIFIMHVVLGFHGCAFLFGLRALRIVQDPGVPVPNKRVRKIGLIALLMMWMCGFFAILTVQIWLHATFLLLVNASRLWVTWWWSPRILSGLFMIWMSCLSGSSALLIVSPVIGGELGKRTWRSFPTLRRISVIVKRAVRWVERTRWYRALKRLAERYDRTLW